MSKDDWEIYNRGKLHAYSIILDMLDLTNSYDDIKKTVKRLINRHQEEAENIEKLDNADVAPVVHAHWKNVKRVLNTEWGECSNCDRANELTRYCPYCGANMREGGGVREQE